MTQKNPPVAELLFTDPPRGPVNKYDWYAVADALRAKPNQWALIFENGPLSLVTSIRQGVQALPRDEFEIRTTDNVKTAPRTCTLYLRYVPKKNRKK